MKVQSSPVLTQTEPLISQFFRNTAGHWHSQRRYYTLNDGKVKEVTSDMQIDFLATGSEELAILEGLHHFPRNTLLCGAKVSWRSEDSKTGKKQSEDSTLFGALGHTLYRDRGFAIAKPITAEYYFPHPNTLCLRTEYNGSAFEEELKLIGDRYRTRQTIISRAGEEIMIGQYLETRIS
ncbi:MAG: phycobiliprotein lyase [Halothece sp. Uz-M2-17]|nr:phycobiliprotein lyase [Halothece sp. Uz-M2-17]